MYKLIISDLDDTLLTSGAVISPRTERAIAAARERGAIFALASGRMTRAMLPYARQLDITAPMIAYNGAEVYDPIARRTLFSLPVEAEPARRLCAMCEGMDLHIQAYMGDDYFFEADNAYSELYAAAINLAGRAAGVKLSEYIERDCVKLLIVSEPERLAEVRADIDAAFGSVMSISTSRPNYLEFTNTEANKGNALKHLAPMLGVKREEIIAFGDGQNDLGMLAWAGLGFAPANARPEVLRAAPRTMPSNDEDGLARTLESLMAQGLINGGDRGD
jgi:Cof subfamily protein (haloacid dehalogenase superfamily)